MNHQEREALHNAYISGNANHIKTAFMKSPIKLIKFFSGTYLGDKNYSLDVLRKNQLWLSSPKFFNDPFDCAVNADFMEISFQHDLDSLRRFFVGGELPSDFFKDYDIDVLKRLSYYIKGNKYEANVRKVADCVFVSCFSEMSNLQSLRMWGHYANMHKGFCLEYNILDIYKHNLAELMPILYCNEYTFSEPRKNAQDIRKFKLTFACTKAYEWEYEQEWRLFSFSSKCLGQPGFHMPFIAPIRVYLGCKIEDQLKSDILSICKDLGISVLQGVMMPKSYNLKFEKVDED